MKTKKQWEKSELDLDEFLKSGDYISEELRLLIGGYIAPKYCSPDFVQGGYPIKTEDGICFYMTVASLEDGKYMYLGVLPEFKQ